MSYSSGNKLITHIKAKIKEATYISLLIFQDKKLIKSINNNYNNWASNYTEEDMKYDSVFYEISHKKLRDSTNSICFWNSVPHDSPASLEIDEKRKKFGLYNGITILESINKHLTIGINITSDNSTDEDAFYAKVILGKNLFLTIFKDELPEIISLGPPDSLTA